MPVAPTAWFARFVMDQQHTACDRFTLSNPCWVGLVPTLDVGSMSCPFFVVFLMFISKPNCAYSRSSSGLSVAMPQLPGSAAVKAGRGCVEAGLPGITIKCNLRFCQFYGKLACGACVRGWIWLQLEQQMWAALPAVGVE
jgi:hypothetical protein